MLHFTGVAAGIAQGVIMSAIHGVVRSRKFWALVTAITAIAGSFYNGQILGTDAINAAVAALSAYMISISIEDNGK